MTLGVIWNQQQGLRSELKGFLDRCEVQFSFGSRTDELGLGRGRDIEKGI